MLHRRTLDKVAQPGLRFQGWRKLPLGSKIAVLVLALVTLIAVFAPLVAPYNPGATGLAASETVTHVEGVGDIVSSDPATAPSFSHLFGTDATGRDIFSRAVYGARVSLVVGLSATGIALALATVLGAVAATSRKWIGEAVMRVLDVVMSFPGIALAAVLVLAMSTRLPMVPVIIIATAVVYTPQLTRVVRANVLAQFGEDYVAASKVMGARVPWILAKHVVRNCVAPIMVYATVLVADAIVFEASLSFIGAGITSVNTPTWGNMLSEGKALLLSGHWWPTFFPGLMILITTLCLNVLSEGLTDAMASPRIRANVDVEADEEAMQTEHAWKEAGAAVRSHADLPADAVTQAQVSELTGLVEPAAEETPLEERLATLRRAELARQDRLVYPTPEAEPVLEVKNLSIAFPAQHGDVNIVDDVSFSVRPGETMGLVGESGCGKSITSMAVMGLLPPTARITGEILFKGRNILEMTLAEHNALRGHEMSMIYQDALSSLNPSMLIRSQMKQLTRRGGTRSAEELLDLVGLDPVRTLKSYPHELSGGQRQRVLIAMALTRDPSLVIADEPTTALDVTVQKQVIDLLNDLREKLGFAMVFVSHDLALVAKVAHRVTVMYAGQVVEQAGTSELLTNPVHEYTRGLLGAVLSIEAGSNRLHQVRGTVPSPSEFVKGDRFAPRSSYPTVGLDTRPVLKPVAAGSDHFYAVTPELEAILAKEAMS
ncbi:dipeptide/oligopeptide/nickel ABC transporter permease/ATP-binding protein [Actinomyces urogenitalis]|uniref:ABC transporter n=2 Tax=Actinomyces urogenitalis TaxID=103621 RepID=A0A2I1KVY1_9ACTO|nr:dipeptide/oligopeptide/nickel ABC transporter permease/ATP-binding protein [Actinomyces urogenitalis]MBS5977860.1 dipeptide/oligopeptide/nickel ABC transporter permease/ATP-binding protein [Actinomyces urogenitalis]MDK8237893.1 dipeptide/oligopeptide/nickel ABC transporter permease/ATP-binding protein [Actinomyces urogenitalis]MDU6150616.1 dipeptide/oligopeptide/nickel ABC transporter permease/ATP-binding protein [Actinomyces urogenitalis]PKY99790.1 ABC transporter [Actinomyces urogenitalis]